VIDSGPSPYELDEPEIAEASEPIRLFDRKKTRQLRASAQSDEPHAANGASNGKVSASGSFTHDDDGSQSAESVTEPVAQNGTVEEHWGDEEEAPSEAEPASERA
jgi:hypothetical protein